MKKKSIIVTVLLAAAMLLSVPTYAQVFLQDEELTPRVKGSGGVPTNPDGGGWGYDDGPHGDYAPLGSGAIVLGCLGGMYLLGRRRKEQE